MSRYKPYPEYKDSGVTWMGRVPACWQPIRMKHVFFEKKKTSNPELDAGSISFGRVIYKNSENIAPETKASYQEVLTGEFLVNPLNLNFDLLSLRTALSDIDVVVSTGYIVLNSDVAYDKKYLKWLLQQFDVSHMKTLGAGVRQTINYTDIACCYFLSPSYLEQQKIANFLNHETAKIDTLIAKQQELIKLLKEKRQAVISHAVTKGLNPNAPMRDSGVEWLGEVPAHWVVCRLKQIIASGSSISYGIVQPGDAIDEGVPFVQTTNMSQGTFELADLQKTTEEIARAYPRSKLEGGEVILGIRASIGAAFVVPAKLRGANLSRGVARILPNDQLLSHFLVMYFQTNSVERYWGLSKQGSTFSEVSIETVRELPIPLPPIDEQEEIFEFIKSELYRLDALVDQAVQQESLLKERRTALISAAVTGKIDVRDWQPPSESAIAA